MKGYKLDKTLYIFDATPATIPGTAGDEADLIYVQQELVEEFKYYNPDNSAKIKPYNYKLLAVNKLPWADYIDNDLVEESTEYTVNVKYGETLKQNISTNSLNFVPYLPPYPFAGGYTATEGTQSVFTLSSGSGSGNWFEYREGNTEYPYKIQVTPPESIQDSYEFVWPWRDESDPENPVYRDGSLSFIMPAENVTLDVDFVENESYIDPTNPQGLIVVNNLPSNYRLEVKYLHDQDTPETIDDISSTVYLPFESSIFVYVYDENNNLVNVSPTDSADYSTSHADAQAMVDYHAYCTIGVDETDTQTLPSYIIYNAADSESDNGVGETFVLYTDNTTLTVEVPTVNS